MSSDKRKSQLEENFFDQFKNEGQFYDNKDVTDNNNCKDQIETLKFCLDKNKNSDFCSQIRNLMNICIERSNHIHKIKK